MLEQYELTVLDVQTIFNQSSEVIAIYEKLIGYDPETKECRRDPKRLFHHLFNTLHGNTIKKELELDTVLKQNFRDGELLGDIFDLVEGSSASSGNAFRLSALNAKEIIYCIVDGKYLDRPEVSISEIIKEEIGDIPLAGDGASGGIDYESMITQVLEQNQKTVAKITKRAND